MPESAFRAIIVGGGPIGLAAAHALYLAGIDFVVLERRASVIKDEGASLIVYAHTIRVMHQFGILNDLLSVGTEIKHHLSFTRDGKVFNSSPRWTHLHDSYGYGAIAFHRAELLSIMYNGLPPAARQKVLTDKKLVDIETDCNGAKVTCDDGSVYHGSIVIGADGAHSKTRRLMRELVLKDDPNQSWDPINPYVSNFRLIFGSFPSPSKPGLGYDTQSSGKSVTYFSGSERAWFFLYEKLPKPVTAHTTYTEEDIEALGAEFAEFPLTRDTKVGDVWPHLTRRGMTDLQEGMVEHWRLGRIVLVGDSAHKFTTHLGLGFNDGIQDVVELCNGIHRGIQGSTQGVLDDQAVRTIFEAYEAARKGPDSPLQGDLKNSGFDTRLQTWSNIGYWFLARYLVSLSWVESFISQNVIWPGLRQGKVLDYVIVDEPIQGMISWAYPMRKGVQ